jgi:hypothetical protein
MNKKLSFSLYLIILIILSSCNKQLNQAPIAEIEYQSFWKTASDAKYGMAAVYSGLQKTFDNTFTEWGDARSDNFSSSGTGENQVSISYNGLTATTASADWGDLYNAISRTNLAIKYLPTITDPAFTTTQRNHYLGQAYAVRAFLYFWAVRLWGDVPLRLVPYETIDSTPNLARTSKDTVFYKVIIPDLKKALTLIDKKSLNTFEITTPAILSIQTEVYLWLHDYQNVLSTTSQLIALNKFKLASADNYKDVFITATTSENIWTLNWNYITDGANGIGIKIGSNSNTSNYQIDVPLKIWEADAKTNPTPDIRRFLNYDSSLAASTSSTGQITVPQVIWKFYPIDITTGKPLAPSRTQNQVKLPFYRWPDILTMRAEALNWLNNDKNGALSIVNQIRRRANAIIIDSTKNKYKNQLEVENAILDERQLELFAEAKRWFDLVRTNRVLDVMDPIIRNRQAAVNASITGFSDARKILWPISRTALNADPFLIQNQPYSK